MASDKAKILNTLAGIADMYSENLDVHGVAPKSVGWKDEASQKLRFANLAQLIDTKIACEGISVNDLGCGYGAMFQYLNQIPSVMLSRYYGYDISEKMLTAAEQLVADPRAEFIKSSFVARKADYSFVSGTFHVKGGAIDEIWSEYIKKALMNLAEMSLRGFAFNAFTTYVDWKQENLYYADPFVFFDFCKSNISRYVSLLHDYPLFEWTIIVQKEGYLR